MVDFWGICVAISIADEVLWSLLFEGQVNWSISLKIYWIVLSLDPLLLLHSFSFISLNLAAWCSATDASMSAIEEFWSDSAVLYLKQQDRSQCDTWSRPTRRCLMTMYANRTARRSICLFWAITDSYRAILSKLSCYSRASALSRSCSLVRFWNLVWLLMVFIWISSLSSRFELLSLNGLVIFCILTVIELDLRWSFWTSNMLWFSVSPTVLSCCSTFCLL